jgi:hypothetical protein
MSPAKTSLRSSRLNSTSGTLAGNNEIYAHPARQRALAPRAVMYPFYYEPVQAWFLDDLLALLLSTGAGAQRILVAREYSPTPSASLIDSAFASPSDDRNDS